MAELVIWSPGAAVLAVLRREFRLRKKQNGVRKESVAELMPAGAGFAYSVEASAFVRWSWETKNIGEALEEL